MEMLGTTGCRHEAGMRSDRLDIRVISEVIVPGVEVRSKDPGRRINYCVFAMSTSTLGLVACAVASRRLTPETIYFKLPRSAGHGTNSSTMAFCVRDP